MRTNGTKQPAVLLLALTLLTASCASGKQLLPTRLDSTEAEARAKLLLQAQVKSKKTAGISAVVADSRGLVWTSAAGLAGPEQNFTAQTISNIGSVSKLFVATAVMLLVEQGKMELDAPLSRYLPDFKPISLGPDPEAITIRSLLCHQSGLQSDVLEAFVQPGSFKSQEARPYRHNVELANNTVLTDAIFSAHAYSNLGISLLGLAVEAASGQNLDDFMQQAIFSPLGMRSSSFVYKPEFDEQYAQGKNGKLWIDIPAIRDQPAGSLNASAEDLGRFLSSVLRSAAAENAAEEAAEDTISLLQASSLAEMWQVQNAAVAKDFGMMMGLGWFISQLDRFPELTIYQHGGALPPFYAYALVAPQLDLAVAVQINGNGADTAEIAHDLLELFALAREGRSIGWYPDSAKVASLPLSADRKSSLIGYWATPAGLGSIQNQGRRVVLSLPGQKLEIVERNNGHLGLRLLLPILNLPLNLKELESLVLSQERLDRTDYLILRSGGELAMSLERIQPATIDEAWLARHGRWVRAKPYPEGYPEDFRLFSELELSLDKNSGFFLLKSSMGTLEMSFPLRSASPEILTIMGSGRNLGESIRLIRENGIEYLEYSGIRYVKPKSSTGPNK